MPSSQEIMTARRKAILVNAGILGGLAYQYWQGTSAFLLLVTGIFVVVVANLTMMIAAKNKQDRASREMNAKDSDENARDAE
jgi:glucose uptake protein GlcU